MTRVQVENHKRWIRERACIICRDNTSVQAAHVRYHDPSVAKDNPGKGIKDDIYMVSLCSMCHHKQTNHQYGEQAWWRQFLVDPVKAAIGFYINTGDDRAGDRIVDYWSEIARASR